MNVVGKILVFMNLVFSVLTAGLIVMVFTTRTNWNAAFKTVAARETVVRAQADADIAEARNELLAKDKQMQALLREKQTLEGTLKAEKDQLAQAQTELNALRSVGNAGQSNIQALTAEIERRKAEVENLQRLLATKEQKITEIDKQMARLRDESVQFRIQWEQARDRNADLLRQVESLSREVAELRRQLGGGSTTTPAGPTATPTPTELRGTVQRVEGDLATITPGSDAGVRVGSELTVFRTAGVRGEYLGKITIIAVSPHEAVGRLSGPKYRQIQKNDQVKPQ